MKSGFVSTLIASGFFLASALAVRAQVNISFNYSLDTSGFFSDPGRQALLNAAASALDTRLADTLSAISPSGPNSWTAIFNNPSTGTSQNVNNLSVAANTLVIYVGARDLGAGTLGLGGFGGFNGSGTQSWLDTISMRGQSGAPNTDFGPWGGSISFNNTATWNFSSGLPSAGQNDFYSVALHELGHVLGIGTATSWDNLVNGANQFTGAASMAAFGGAVPLTSDHAHWLSGTMSTLPGTSTFQEAAMDPSLTTGTRKDFTVLDFAGLDDIGWDVTPVPEPGQLALVAGLGLLGFALFRRRVMQRG